MNKTLRFDASRYLDSEEAITEYISAALSANDPELLMEAIATVAKTRGIAKVAQDAGLGRESLYKSLAPKAKPKLETTMKLLGALGVKLQAVQIDRPAESPSPAAK